MGESYVSKISTYKKVFFLVLILLFSVKSFTQDTFADNFNTQSYSVNDGNQNWSTNWIETDPDGNAGPNGNYVGITGGRLFFYWAYQDNESIRRSANLSAYSSAILSFDWETVGLDPNESLRVQISNNGGASYTQIGSLEGNTTGSFSLDISGYISSNTTIRFINTQQNWGSNEYVYIDNFLITATSYTFECDKVYATSSTTGRSSVYELTGATMTPVYTAPQNVGGLGISSNGNAYYDNATFTNPPLYISNGGIQTTNGATMPNLRVGQAADALGNVYYIDSSYHLRRVNNGATGTATDLGPLVFDAGDTIGPSLAFGDMTFDGNGRLHWYASVGGSGASYLYVINTNTLETKSLGNVGPNTATGIAFDSSGNMITSTSNGDGTSDIYSIDFSSPTLSGTLIGTASPGVYDMGSCSTPTYNPNLTATKSVKNITKSADPAVIALSGDVLEYTIIVNNIGNLSASNATFIDAIPASTTYIANSTQLNGVSVADVGGNMPYITATEIHSDTQPDGVVTIGSPVTITFRVTVDNGTLPANIDNTGTVEYPIVTGGVTTNQSVDSNTVSTPTGDICTLGTNDSDGDGIDDICDLDDDNDGILDSVEGSCSTSDFIIFGGDGGSTASFSQSAVSSAIFNFYYVDNSVSVSINGGGLNVNNILQLETAAVAGEVFLEFTDGAAMSAPWVANNNGLPRLKVEIDFLGNVTVYGSRSTNSTSLELMQIRGGGTFNTISFLAGSNSFVIKNQNGTGLDAVGGVATVFSSCTDTDNDNIPNYLDTDSDGDGCFDAIEGDENVSISDLSGGRITGGVDSDGVPNIVNSGGSADGGNNTQGQGNTTAVVTSAQIVINTDLAVNTPLCAGETANFTFTATGVDSGEPVTNWTYQLQKQNGLNWNSVGSLGSLTNNVSEAKTISITNAQTADSGTYRVLFTHPNNSCEQISQSVSLTVNELPTPIDTPLTICPSETSTDLTVNDSTVLDGETGTVTWYDGEPGNGGTAIASPTTANLNTITDLWAQVSLSSNGCAANVDITTNIDTTAPVISLVGLASQTIESCGTYTEEGATVTDCESGLTATIGGDTVDTTTPGVYTV
ncbi:hypothetical protein ACT8OO_14190, partial [Tenacibaculum discolor]